MGKLIVIEGLDGSGKATQSELLRRALAGVGVPIRKVSFPNYDSDAAAPVKMYLAGEFGKDPGDVNAFAASCFFAVDRFASFKQDWGKDYGEGGVIIADRYTTSNGIHQCSKLPREQWEEYLGWLFDFEYGRIGIPKPDLVIYLRVDPMVSQVLMSRRYSGDESRKDIHERNLTYLDRSRQAAEFCAESLGWQTVQCDRDGQMRSVEDIHQEIRDLVSRELGL